MNKPETIAAIAAYLTKTFIWSDPTKVPADECVKEATFIYETWIEQCICGETSPYPQKCPAHS